jgi:phage FluMu protein Com
MNKRKPNLTQDQIAKAYLENKLCSNCDNVNFMKDKCEASEETMELPDENTCEFWWRETNKMVSISADGKIVPTYVRVRKKRT